VDAEPYELTQTDPPLSLEELLLAFRNRGMPLEAMRYDVTPTGLHYLLIHWDIPAVDPATWRLQVGGAVDRPLSLSMDDVRSRPAVTHTVTMECAGNGRAQLSPRPLGQPWLHEAVGTAEWTGTPLRAVLDDAGVRADAVELVFTGADSGYQGDVLQDYQRSLTVADATRPEVLLAYEMNGRPLEPQHGSPLRLLVPGWYGMTSVKWLTGIEAVTAPFEGYQQAATYRLQRDEDDPGTLVTRMVPRALMTPPGITDYPARRRFLAPGPVTISGRAWSGRGPVERVEFGVDGDWNDAALGPAAGEFAWRPWTYDWDATPGDHDLSCRASDAAGNVQPLEQPWSIGGFANNLVQTVRVSVA
jgi:DMSO/TMAO reductase YedYZ molybdopterin-dependent catalytic subunit